MIAAKDFVAKARGDAQALHAKIEETTGKTQAALRSTLENAAGEAKDLANSIKSFAESQRADTKQHLQNAVKQFEEVAKHGTTIAGASERQMEEAGRAMLDRSRGALQLLSNALATARTSASKN